MDKYPNTTTGIIRFAYDQLSDDDKIQIDLQVKHILDYIELLNRDKRERGKAIIQMSRDGALELLFKLGRFQALRLS